ncbi:MAG: DUF1993 family protein [Parvibaculaceae bacterium]
MHQASLPVLVHMLKALKTVIGKAEAHVAARKLDPDALLAFRLYPDMFTFRRQVQLATDFAKGAGARLSGQEVPKYDDTEQTFDELKARLDKTMAFLEGIDPKALEGSESREVTLNIGGKPMPFQGADYLFHFVLPNFYFHLATAYDILRHNGVEIGKRDFLGRA